MTYDHASYFAMVTLDCQFSKPSGVAIEAHAAKVLEEIERVINASKADPDAHWNFAYLDSYSWKGQFTDQFLATLIVVLDRLGQAVPT